MRPDRLVVAAVAAFAAVLLAVPALADDATPTPTPSTSSSSTPSAGAIEVDDATLRWGINNETSNRAYAPNTFNFLSAGKVPDPGSGGKTIARADWSQRSGQVAIEKWNGSSWRPATWAGLSTDSSGKPLGSPTSGTFSDHTFLLSGGTGTVDLDAGTAHLSWDGDLTVLYYSGMSFFYLSDQVLDVTDGVGRLTATVSGFASSLDDPTEWAPVAPRTVTVASLPTVDLADENGFVATPAYRGVRVTGVPQNTSGPDAGAFPQSWVDLMDDLGTAAFWYSSGAATDPFKVTLPLTVGYDASVPVVAPSPTTAPTKAPIKNEIKTPPPPTPTVTTTVTATPAPPTAAAPAVVAPVAAPLVAPAPVAAPALGAVPQPVTQVALAAAASVAPEPDGSSSLPWWIGSGCLLAAALVLLLPVGRSGAGSRSAQS